MGGDRRPEDELAALDQAADAPTEGQGQAGLCGAQPGPPRLHAVLHERLVPGLRPGVQVQHQRR